MAMELDPVLLARLQFAFTISFHILFPALTIGLSGFLLLLEVLWLKTGDEAFHRLARFWMKIFALGFGMGVVSGVVLSYQLGTNFSGFARATGNVLGPLLAYEVLTAFFLEAGFLGIMLFGWDRVGRGLHLFATACVAVGTMISAFWILAANSWMQTPSGYALVNGTFFATDFWAVVFNPSFPYRFVHTILASYLTAAFVVIAVSAWWTLRGEHKAAARHGLAFGLGLAAILAPLQIYAGDLHGLNVREHQPLKVAAMEGLWETTRGAPLLLFALPDPKTESNRFEIGVPKLASLILTHDWDGEVIGLKSAPPENRPPVMQVFWSFRVMVGIGFAMLCLAWAGALFLLRRSLERQTWLLRLLVWAGPSGFVATLAGWYVAEIGRQPWVVYGILRTADAVSPVPAGSILTTLLLFIAAYTVLLGAFLYYGAKLVRHGPDVPEVASVPPGAGSNRPLAATPGNL